MLKTESHLATISIWPLAYGFFLLGMFISRLRIAPFSITALVVAYQDFGFIKRGFLGTILYPFVPQQISSVMAVAIWACFGAFTGGLVCFLIYSLSQTRDRSVQLVAISSPALFMQLGYTFYYLDILCIAFYSFSLFLVIRLRCLGVSARVMILSLVVGAALVHEISLLALLPTLVVVSWQRCRSLARSLLLAGVFIGSLLAAFGSFQLGAEQLSRRLQQRFVGITDISTFELTSSLSTNIVKTFDYLILQGHALTALPAYIYLGLVLSCVISGRGLRSSHYLLILACLSPLLITVFAGDISRWVGLACLNLWLMILTEHLPITVSRWRLPALLMSTLLGPIGIVAAFPLIQSKFRFLPLLG